MTFDLFTIDFIPEDRAYGIYFFSIKNWEKNTVRSLFSFTSIHKFIYIDLFFIPLLEEI